eukprot:COSAG05_NODE_2910_length_2516_cov_3.187422_2_plen_72_part_00
MRLGVDDIKTNTNDDEDDGDDTTQRTKNTDKDDIYGCVAIESVMRASKKYVNLSHAWFLKYGHLQRAIVAQ